MARSDRRSGDRRKQSDHVQIERRHGDRRSAERRRTVRVPLELWMEEVSGDDVYFRRTGNVGEGGVYFDKAIPHPLGTMVTLKFALPGDKEMIVARGEVVSSAPDPEGLGMGVRFISVEGEGGARIRDYVTRR
jgi:uncharacterized protein (TIGR02266 family)